MTTVAMNVLRSYTKWTTGEETRLKISTAWTRRRRTKQKSQKKGGRTINDGAAGKYRCSRFSKRGCGERPTEPANRCTACALFLLDFSKPIERSRSGSNTRSLHARRDHRLPRYTTKNVAARHAQSLTSIYIGTVAGNDRSYTNVPSTSTIKIFHYEFFADETDYDFVQYTFKKGQGHEAIIVWRNRIRTCSTVWSKLNKQRSIT